MAQIQNERIELCLNDMQKCEKWGNLLARQCFVNFFNSNAPVSALTIHNGMEYIKAKMNLSVLQDNSHTDEDREKRLKQIDFGIHHTEDIMKHDLEYRGLLIP